MKKNTTARTLSSSELLSLINYDLRQAARSIKRNVTLYIKAKKNTITMERFIKAIDDDNELNDLTAKTLAKIALGTIAFALIGSIAF